ncbi:MAG: DNA polymerase III subunit beta [Corynebacterium glucuronolyticum]|nr:DNA polymerase III subunit beta [Mycobacteriaceae bacterium]MDY5834020.1 DNA polymerase III subunit beta [Corynebacterium glucuronolyticum]
MESQAVAFRVAQDDFADAVSWVAHNLPTRPVQPVLRGLVITATDEGLELAGFDYEVSTKVRLNAQVTQNGRLAVAGKLISDITSSLAAGTVEVETDETHSKLQLVCGKAKFELPLIPLDEYPSLPAMPQTAGRVDPHQFTEAVSQVATAAGKDDALPMLTGIHVEIEGSDLVMVATDRFRLAVRHLEWEPTREPEKSNLLIPARTLQDTAKSMDNGLNKPLEIALGNGLIGMVTENRRTTTRLLDAEFPNYNPLLPKAHNYIATCDIDEMLKALRRVSLVADKSGQIRMTFTEGQVSLTAANSESGTAEEILPAAFQGIEDELLIAFNPSYLRDGLNVMRSKRVMFGFTDSNRSAILIPEPDDIPEANADGSFPSPHSVVTYLLMPVRLPG